MARTRRLTAQQRATIKDMAQAGHDIADCARAVGCTGNGASPYWHAAVDTPLVTDPLAPGPGDPELRQRWLKLLPAMRAAMQSAAAA